MQGEVKGREEGEGEMVERENVREVEREGVDGGKREGKLEGNGERALLSSCGTATIGSTTYAIPSVNKATFLSPLQENVSITCRWNLEITVDYYRLLQITNLLWGILSTTAFPLLRR